MNVRCFLLVAIAALLFLAGGLEPVSAQGQTTAQQETSQTTITDAAGRTHRVMPMRRTTPEQRKAAAKRLKDAVAERNGAKGQRAPTAQSEVKQ